ncbi:MAG: hypothetical protein AB1Z67_01570 [Candidatus Limnocylindrales bacterium]
MSTTPGTEAGDQRSGNRRRWIIVGIVAVIVVTVVVAAAGWWYFYGQPAPEAPTIDNALQQLLPTDAPE